MTEKSYFISDLHMFSSRSHAEEHVDEIQRLAAHAQYFVLGGDIFDFRWTTLSSVDRTIEAAIDWLDQLVRLNTDCQFHFVLGNHDCAPPFVSQLDRYAAHSPNLTWHDHWVRLGHSVFLHGDVADRPGITSDRLERRRSRHRLHRKKGPVGNMLYDAVVQAGLHKAVGSLANPKRQVAARILSYLEHVGQGRDTGLRHVYFGHTHIPMADYRYGGLNFHNGGATIRGLDFRIVEAEIAI